MASKKICLCLIFCLNLLKTTAQSPRFFQHFDSKDGLSSDVVTAICRDRQGYLWVGTDYGLNRFDGYNFKQYLPDNQLDTKTISNEKINNIKEDDNGFLWIATDEGLFRYNPQKTTFQRFLNTGRADNSLPNSLVTSILCDKEKIWLACDNRDLCYFDSQSSSFKTLAWKKFVDENVPAFAAKSYKTIYNFLEKIGNEIYFNTNCGVFSLNTDNQQFRLINIKEKLVKNKALLAAENTIFIGTFEDDFYQYSLSEDKSKQYKLPLSEAYISGNRSVNHIFKNKEIYWILSNSGLFVFDDKMLKIKAIQPNFENKNTAPTGSLTTYFQERNATIWLGGNKGLWLFSPQKQHFDFTPIFESAKKEFYQPYSNVLISKVDGRKYVTNFYKRKLLVFEKEQLIKTIILPDWRVQILYEDSKGNLWVNASSRLFQINRKNLTINEIKINSNLINTNEKSYFTAMCEDNEGNIWLANSIQWLIKWNKNMQIWEKPLVNSSEYDPKSVTSLLADYQHKTVWIGTEDYSLIRYDEATKHFQQYEKEDNNTQYSLAGYSVYDLAKDQKGNIWIATAPGGLSCFRYDAPKGKEFQNFKTEKGLPSNNVWQLCSDAKGNIWGGTNRGLFCLNTDNQGISTFSEKNGMLTSFFDAMLNTASDGKIYFSHTDGLQSFYPDSVLQQKSSTKILLNQFKIFDKNYTDTLNINELREVNLTWKQNFFSFDFSSEDFSNIDQIQYAYQLKGFDADWISAGKNHQVAYTNVPAGDYIFEVKSGQNGVFNEIGYSLKIHIEAPFWQKTWFKLLVFSFFCALIYSIYRYRIAQIRKEEKLKTEFNERLAKVEMSALRAQMNPHFVFNCLSSINRFILVNQPDEASNYLTKFSRLIRLILDNSRNETVALDKELDTLRLYIDMEAMRFNNRFTYSIDIEEDIQVEHLEVPPLLIQPYVENAIWHGLMHLEKEGKLHIHVFYDQETLCINIEDNGIGRAKAAELKSKSATSQKSHGMEVTAARIDIINQLYNTNNQVFITDLYNEKGEASGTRVELRLS